MRRSLSVSCLLNLSLVVAATASQPGETKLITRVVDVGAGLCCITVTPDNHYFVFDTGNYKDSGATAALAMDELIPRGSTIDLMVLSHCDADHLAAAAYICKHYTVKEVWRDGLRRPESDTWLKMDEAIRKEARDEGCKDLNLHKVEIEPGYQIAIGQETTVTFLCGFGEIPEDWPELDAAEDRNARSVVARLDYGEASILFGGDTVGRHRGDPVNTCIAAEKFLVDNRNEVSLDVDLVIAPHHGADNGSSTAFVEATSPRYVIFSAGHAFNHPRKQAAQRWIDSGVEGDKILRTDRGDNEGDPEWRVGGGNSIDQAGDDDVNIRLSRNGRIEVSYQDRVRNWQVPRDDLALRVRGFSKALGAPRLPAHILDYVMNEGRSRFEAGDEEAEGEVLALASAAPSRAPHVESRRALSHRRWFRRWRRCNDHAR